MANQLNINNHRNNQIGGAVPPQNQRRCANILSVGLVGLAMLTSAFLYRSVLDKQQALQQISILFNEMEPCRTKIQEVIDEKCKDMQPTSTRSGIYSNWGPNLAVELDETKRDVRVIVDTSFCAALRTEDETAALQSLRKAFDVALAGLKSVGKQIQNVGTNFQNEVQLLRHRMNDTQSNAS
jgi:hypothetical protein